jgi:hypothetical protein
LDPQGEVGADALSLTDDVAELGVAHVHGFRGFDLGDAVMGDGVADEGGGGIGFGLGGLLRISGDGGDFHFSGCSVGIRSVGVFDFDEFDVFHFLILPLEGDAPWGFSGVRIDRNFFEFP